MRRHLLPALALLLTAASVPALPSGSSDECDAVPEAGPRACASAEAAGIVLAGLCDQPGVVPAEECGTTRGVTVDPALVDAYEASDLAALHALQRQLGSALPLARAQMLSTHNSYNATSYLPSVANQDPNQFYGLADQLRMGARQIELDVHTWYGVDGDGQLPVLCHATGPHLGCSADRPLVDGLREIRAWLDDNPGEVVMIDVEDHLDGAAGHDEAAAVVADVLGDVLYAPPAGEPCADLPLATSLDDIAAAGAQVLLVSSCGAGDAWPALAHGYGSWRQGRLGSFDVDSCGPDFDRTAYDTGWTRYWEDTTWLSVMAGGPGPRLEGDVLRAAMDCGLSVASLDKLHPEDPRLELLLWSWALDETPHRAGPGSTASIGADGRLHVTTPPAPPLDPTTTVTQPLVCRDAAGDVGVVLAEVPLVAVSHHDLTTLDAACGDDAALSTPRSAREMAVTVASASALGVDSPLLVDIRAVSAGDGVSWVAR